MTVPVPPKMVASGPEYEKLGLYSTLTPTVSSGAPLNQKEPSFGAYQSILIPQYCPTTTSYHCVFPW